MNGIIKKCKIKIVQIENIFGGTKVVFGKAFSAIPNSAFGIPNLIEKGDSAGRKQFSEKPLTQFRIPHSEFRIYKNERLDRSENQR